MHFIVRRLSLLGALALFAVCAFARSGGAGGTFFGIQRPDMAPEFFPSLGADLGIEHFGGFGYGVGSDGYIVGGFGMAFLDRGLLGDTNAPPQHLAGGIGGLIVGQRFIREGRFHLDLCMRLGLGGVGKKDSGWTGWALAYAEPYAEFLIEIAPWMALSAQLGYRFLGNFAPGLAFENLVMRSPVIGFAISWGRF